MYIVTNYGMAVLLCVVTMICWGSWANTQKLATKEWRFQLFYWDYAVGVLVLSLILAFTLGSIGNAGRGFLPDLQQAEGRWLGSAFLGELSLICPIFSWSPRSTLPVWPWLFRSG